MKLRLSSFTQKIFSGTSLRLKLLLIYFLLLLLPLGIFTFYAFHRISALTQEQTFTAARKTFDETAAALENSFGRLDEVLDILSLDSSVYQVSSDNHADYTARLTDSDRLLTVFNHLKTLSGVHQIRLYIWNDYLYSNQKADILYAADYEDSHWFHMLSSGDAVCWLAPGDFYDQAAQEQNWFSAARILYDPTDIQKPLAVLRADLDASDLQDTVSNANLTANGSFLLLRGDETVLTSLNTVNETLISRLTPQLADTVSSQWETCTVDGKRYYILCRPLQYADWRIASVLPYDDVYSLSRELRAEMCLIVVLLGAAAYALAYLISQSSLKRISLLAHTMYRVEQGDVSTRLTPVGRDEIGQLMGSYARMMERIDSLLEEKVEYGRQIKNLELKALQAQINPHFLYNTLDLISCTALLHGVPEIRETVNALARFYKLSLSGGKEVISIEQELTHAMLYVQIQNMRFENRIHMKLEAEDSVKSCTIIKIILQPIIENAIIHGIFEKPDKTGSISVTASRSADGIRISVADDGIGMDEETLRINFSLAPDGRITETRGGYGICNIHDRLRLAYGSPYGLSCQSTPGKGTVVTVFIPAIEDGDTQI